MTLEKSPHADCYTVKELHDVFHRIGYDGIVRVDGHLSAAQLRFLADAVDQAVKNEQGG
jgi:hypothetical protein